MKKIKINLSVPGSFHVLQILNDLNGDDFLFSVYTSSFKLRQKIKQSSLKNVEVTYVPKFFQLLEKITKLKFSRKIKYFDVILFDFLVSILMKRDFDVFYGFAGNSLLSCKKTKKLNKKFILDRACPHVDYQEMILNDESKITGYNFIGNLTKSIDRSKEEYKMADNIIVPSFYTKKSFPKKYHSKIVFCPLDANFKSTHVLFRKNNEIVFGSVGGNPLRKGFYHLVKAWEKFEKSIEVPVKLLIKCRQDILLSSCKVKDIINNSKSILVFDKYIDDMSEFYNKIDFFILPSVDEGFGMVIPEAMSFSKGCIATNNVGASFLIKNDQNGYVVPYSNHNALYKSLKKVIDKKENLKEMGDKSSKIYKDYIRSRKDNIKEFKKVFYDI